MNLQASGPSRPTEQDLQDLLKHCRLIAFSVLVTSISLTVLSLDVDTKLRRARSQASSLKAIIAALGSSRSSAPWADGEVELQHLVKTQFASDFATFLRHAKILDPNEVAQTRRRLLEQHDPQESATGVRSHNTAVRFRLGASLGDLVQKSHRRHDPELGISGDQLYSFQLPLFIVNDGYTYTFDPALSSANPALFFSDKQPLFRISTLADFQQTWDDFVRTRQVFLPTFVAPFLFVMDPRTRIGHGYWEIEFKDPASELRVPRATRLLRASGRPGSPGDFHAELQIEVGSAPEEIHGSRAEFAKPPVGSEYTHCAVFAYSDSPYVFCVPIACKSVIVNFHEWCSRVRSDPGEVDSPVSVLRGMPFEMSFAELSSVCKGWDNASVGSLEGIIGSLEGTAAAPVEVLGTKVSKHFAARWGLAAILGVLLYGYLHLAVATKWMRVLKVVIPWNALYAGPLNAAVLYCSIGVLPIFIACWLAFDSLRLGGWTRDATAIVPLAFGVLLAAGANCVEARKFRRSVFGRKAAP